MSQERKALVLGLCMAAGFLTVDALAYWWTGR